MLLLYALLLFLMLLLILIMLVFFHMLCYFCCCCCGYASGGRPSGVHGTNQDAEVTNLDLVDTHRPQLRAWTWKLFQSNGLVNWGYSMKPSFLWPSPPPPSPPQRDRHRVTIARKVARHRNDLRPVKYGMKSSNVCR